MNTRRALELVDAVAEDVGRLRRGVDPASSLRHAVDRIAGRIETLDCMMRPTAGELFAVYRAECGDEELAVADAIAVVEKQQRQLRTRLGEAA